MPNEIETRLRALDNDLEELEVLIQEQGFLFKRITNHVKKLHEMADDKAALHSD